MRLSALALLFALPAAAQVPVSYSITQVHDSPFGGRANTVNDAGLVGGSVAIADPRGLLDPSQAFLWQDGTVVWQGTLGANSAGIASLTESGRALGLGVTAEAPFSGEFAVFVRTESGGVATVPAPALTGGYRQIAYTGAINEAGLATARWRVVTAATTPASGPTYHPIVWDTNTGETTVLPTINDLYARSEGIAADGSVCGAAIPTGGDIIHAVRWTRGAAGAYTLTDLGTIGGGTYSECNAMNASGVAFGEATTAANGNAQPAIWEPGQPGRLLPMPAGANSCGASDISESGVAAGRCDIARTPRAVVWIDGQPVVLQSRLDAASSAAGWQLEAAYGVNNLGWIVGVATRAGFVDSDGNPESFGFLARPNGTVANEGAPEAPAVTVGPNPASRVATVRVGTAADVTVLDVLGRTVARERGVSEARLDVRGWAPGVYVAVVQRGGATTRTPFTVVR